MPAPTITPELKKDLEILKVRFLLLLIARCSKNSFPFEFFLLFFFGQSWGDFSCFAIVFGEMYILV